MPPLFLWVTARRYRSAYAPHSARMDQWRKEELSHAVFFNVDPVAESSQQASLRVRPE